MGAKVVHFEIVTQGDLGELQSFYSDLFGWNITVAGIPGSDVEYAMVSPDDAGINGGLGRDPDPNSPGHVTFYIQVPDPAATLEEIKGRGGQVLMGPEEILPGTTIALFLDPQGHMIGLTKGE